MLISSPLLQAIQAQEIGTDFWGAIGSMRVVFIAYAFVDDTDLIETITNDGETIHHVMYQMQESIEL